MTEATDSTDEAFLARPIVQASGNIVDINDKLVPGEYFGAVHLGKNLDTVQVTYSTMINQVVISSNNKFYTPDTSEDGTAT